MGLVSRALEAQDAPRARPRPRILVHVMPWFESKPVSGHWGWHWTMGRLDPERVDPTGRRAIASHLYPLIGPYDSADPDVLEYQTLLMRIAGIDGVVADWYGSEDFNDYAAIHQRTRLLLEATRRRGLSHAVCYEDRVIRAMAEKTKLSPAQAVEHALNHLRFCQDHWFKDPAYVRWRGSPVLLVFGPDYLKPDQWESLLGGLDPRPALFTLHERKPAAAGRFAWPPMWAAKDGVLDQAGLAQYLDRFGAQEGPMIAAAFPGFHDFYQEAGVQPSHGRLEARGGETLRFTLKRALASGAPIVQVATWNDFGEGTCIEPTREFGYVPLETIQVARRALDPAFPYRPEQLRLPRVVYQLRKVTPVSSPDREALDHAVSLLDAARNGEAAERLRELEKARIPNPGP